jgi:hypothetical protein
VDVESIEKQLNFSCPICMDEVQLETSTLCGHFFFCQDCICNIINAQNTCPIC